MSDSGHPLPLILARNLISLLAVPAFITDDEGTIVFYNDAAGGVLGKRFEETGRLSREEWNRIGPLDEEGNPIGQRQMPLTIALRESRPAYGRFRIATDSGGIDCVDTCAVPLVEADRAAGAMVLFWPLDGGGL